MPETQAAAGQPMPEAAADTCGGGARHGLDPMVLTTMTGGDAAPPVTHVEAPVVRDGDAMGRAADIGQDVCRICTGCLGVANPLVRIARRAKRRAALRHAPCCGALSAGQGAGGVCLGQRRAALPAQDGAQGAPGQEEAGSCIAPGPAVSGQRPGRDAAVDMARRPSRLVPGVQDHGAPALPAAVAGPTRDEGLTGGVAQDGAARSLGGQDEGGEVVWHANHQVERGPRQPCSVPVRTPLPLGNRLTLRTVAIATGLIRVPLAPTAGPVCGVPPALCGPAGRALVPPLLMRGRYGMGPAGGRPGEAAALGDVPRWGAGLAHCCRLWAGGGRRRHGMTPA